MDSPVHTPIKIDQLKLTTYKLKFTSNLPITHKQKRERLMVTHIHTPTMYLTPTKLKIETRNQSLINKKEKLGLLGTPVDTPTKLIRSKLETNHTKHKKQKKNKKNKKQESSKELSRESSHKKPQFKYFYSLFLLTTHLEATLAKD